MCYRSAFSSQYIIQALVLIFLLSARWASAAEDDLLSLDVEDLLQMEITSVSKKPEQLMDASAAIYVITNEAIKNSGVTLLPEALRLAPGINVAKIDANKWAISSRGFLDRFSSKLLVLIDGRSVYTPTFSGVYWDVQDVLLEDVERIEVIRGPGATLWGANAVNGVINVITKSAKDTLSGLTGFSSGSKERNAYMRYGISFEEGAYLRGYIKHRDIDDLATLLGKGRDAWYVTQGGFRADSAIKNGNSWTIQGDIYDGNINQVIVKPLVTVPFSTVIPGDVAVAGSNILVRWNSSSNGNELSAQLYFDYQKRLDQILEEKRSTWDFDFQQRLKLIHNSEFIWGGGIRYSEDNTQAGETARLIPAKDQFTLFNAFLQFEYPVADNIKVVIGSKFEEHDYSGFVNQPNFRFNWRLNQKSTFWASISKAIRTPSRGERNAEIDIFTIPSMTSKNLSPWPLLFRVVGNENMKPNRMWAYEVGYRQLITANLSIDIAAFYNDYDQLESISFSEIICLPSTYDFPQCPLTDYLVQQGFISNSSSGHTEGLEALFDWHFSEDINFQAAYSYLTIKQDSNASSEGNSLDTGLAGFAETSPEHQFSIRSQWEIATQWLLNFEIRHIAKLPALDIDSYTIGNVHLIWNVSHDLELKIVGENIGAKHQEFSQGLILGAPSIIESSFRFGLNWRF